MALHDNTASDQGDQPLVETIIVYGRPGDRRATPCLIENLEAGRAYLIPCPRPDIGWVALDDLILSPPRCTRGAYLLGHIRAWASLAGLKPNGPTTQGQLHVPRGTAALVETCGLLYRW